MMDDQLVEIDTVKFEVSRRFSLAKGKEGPLPASADRARRPRDARRGLRRRNRPSIPPTSATPADAPRDDAGDVLAHLGAAVGERQKDLRRLQQGRRDSRDRSRRPGRSHAASRPAAASTTSRSRPTASCWSPRSSRAACSRSSTSPSGKSLARLKTSTTLAHGVAVSPDSRYAFVSSEGVGSAPGKVDVVRSAARSRVAGTVDVGQQASGIAFWKMSAGK